LACDELGNLATLSVGRAAVPGRCRVSDDQVEFIDASEVDLDHEDATDEEPVPLTDSEMLELDPGEDGSR
jgi:hypothetical protein